MPNTDASQYTSFKKYTAASVGNDKPHVSRYNQIVPRVTSAGNPQEFLSTIRNTSIVSTVSYLTTNVTNQLFGRGDEVIFSDKPISDSSEFTDYGIAGNAPMPKYGHYFNLNNLDESYTYTFETTAANFPDQSNPDDTIIVLFNSQTKPLLYSQQLDYEDDKAGGSSLSELSDKNIRGNWCLVVTSYDKLKIGTFTLKITRTLKPSIVYLTTDVTNQSFSNGTQVIFSNKTISNSSPFNISNESKYGHYFNLNDLDTSYNYTFEVTAANFPNQVPLNDTVIILFNSQTKPFTIFQAEDANDDASIGVSLSKLSSVDIRGNWCLVVTSSYELKIGTFTLKITRTLK